MIRILFIDQDRVSAQKLGLECLERGVGIVMAENVCEGVRTLLSEMVSFIAVDAALLRLTPHEHARMFDHVAPGVPVVVVTRPDTPLESRVALELAGFRVLVRPITVEDLLEKA